MIYRAKEPVKKICFQLQGKSILYNVTHSGSRKIIFVLGQGELLNDHVLNIHESSLFCEAIEKSRILEIPSGLFLREMEKDFSLTKAVIAAQEKKIWRMGHQLKNTRGKHLSGEKTGGQALEAGTGFRPEDRGRDRNRLKSVHHLSGRSSGCSTGDGFPRLQISGSPAADYYAAERIIITDPDRMSQFYKSGS